MIIFVANKDGADELSFAVSSKLGFPSVSLHGDKHQSDRSAALKKFKKGEVGVLIATDVASRGLHIEDVRTVVNYDVAKNIETHGKRASLISSFILCFSSTSVRFVTFPFSYMDTKSSSSCWKNREDGERRSGAR